MTSTIQQPISLLKITVIVLTLILAPVVLTYFTFGIENYATLLRNIVASVAILLFTISVFFIIALKKEKAQIQQGWLLYVILVCSLIPIMSMMLFK